MKARHCIAINWLGAGIAFSAACMTYPTGAVGLLAGWLMTAGILCTLVGVIGLVVVEPEVWP